MNKIVIYALCTQAMLFSASVLADVYKCTSDTGTPTFVDASTKANYKNCVLIMHNNGTRNNGSPALSNKPVSSRPSNFPQVDQYTQNQRDDKRKAILQSELSTEQQALESAKSQHASTEIEQHQKNIQLLQKEVGALK